MEPMLAKDPQGDRLNGLFAAYRDACPDVEGSPDFMPKLWQRIESRRVETTSIFRRLAQVCVATAAVVVILSSVLMPASQDSEVLYSSTYTEVLAADYENQAVVQALPAELPGDTK